MGKITAILIGAGLAEDMYTPPMHWNIQMNFKL